MDVAAKASWARVSKPESSTATITPRAVEAQLVEAGDVDLRDLAQRTCRSRGAATCGTRRWRAGRDAAARGRATGLFAALAVAAHRLHAGHEGQGGDGGHLLPRVASTLIAFSQRDTLRTRVGERRTAATYSCAHGRVLEGGAGTRPARRRGGRGRARSRSGRERHRLRRRPLVLEVHPHRLPAGAVGRGRDRGRVAACGGWAADATRDGARRRRPPPPASSATRRGGASPARSRARASAARGRRCAPGGARRGRRGGSRRRIRPACRGP